MATHFIEQIKDQGAILGLEAEINTRIMGIRDAYEKKKWAYVRSHAVVISEVAEELRKLCESTSQKPNSKQSSTL